MGEVVAGIALGPSVLGAIAPDLAGRPVPADILPAFGVAANLGLIFYMFLVGLELDPRQLRGRIGQAAAISNSSVALPMMLGLAIALPLYQLARRRTRSSSPFALFMGVAMSITAFPVLARILVERRMLKRPVGALTLACAAIDDVTAWFLIALATAVAAPARGRRGRRDHRLGDRVLPGHDARASGRCSARVVDAYDEAGRVPGGWVAAIFAGVLLSAYATEEIGIAVIFGGFMMGMVMPRHARADRGRDAADRGLRGRPAAAAVLRLHRAEDQHRPARPARLWLITLAPDRRRDRRQVRRRGVRRAARPASTGAPRP